MLVLSEEERILRSAAEDFLAERSPVSALRRLRDEAVPEAFDRGLWQEMAELGWTGLLVPERHGGSAVGFRGLGQVLEASGQVLLASPLLSCALIAPAALMLFGTDAQQSLWLPRLAAGNAILALALDDTPRHAPTRIVTRAIPETNGYRLSGTKPFIPDGHGADLLLVVARVESREPKSGPAPLGIFLIPSDAPGLSIERLAMADSRNMARARFTEVAVDASQLLGGTPLPPEALETLLDIARIGLAAEMLGSARRAFEKTLAYLKLREQFGVPIGSFQALKHRAALMYCELELTTSAVRAALAALDAGQVERPALASLAKAKASELAALVSSEAVQMHGGIGMTDAEDLGFFLKRARVAQQLFGDAAFHRERYATLQGF
jgi:alkylation response protein AidB-like acyl-CoA dehydrogenase